MPPTTPPRPGPRPPYSIREASESTGLSRTTILGMIKLGDFDAARVGLKGGKWMITAESIDRWHRQFDSDAKQTALKTQARIRRFQRRA